MWFFSVFPNSFTSWCKWKVITFVWHLEVNWKGFVSVYMGLIDNIHYFFVSYNYKKNKYKVLKEILDIHVKLINKIFSWKFNEKLELASFNITFYIRRLAWNDYTLFPIKILVMTLNLGDKDNLNLVLQSFQNLQQLKLYLKCLTAVHFLLLKNTMMK